MGEHDLEKALRTALGSPNAPEPSDNVVDAILSSGRDAGVESLHRIRRRFAEKLFLDRYPEPERSSQKGTTLGDFLEKRRTETGLRRSGVAFALGGEERGVEDLEKGRVSPWKLTPAVGGQIMNLFRVHIETLGHLVAASFAVSRSSGLGKVQARSSHRGHSSSRGDSANRALERFLAHEAGE